MTDDRSLERAARSFIEAGPTQAPDRAVEAALLRIQTTPQERDLRIPWKYFSMTIPARVAVAAVVGVMLVGAAAYYFGRPGQPAVGGPGPSPSSSAPVSPIASPRPASSGAVVDYTGLPGWIVFERAGKAPDGSTPAGVEYPHSLWLIHADGSDLHELAPGVPASGKISFDISPDGSHVIFSAYDPPVQVWEVGIDGGEQVLLSTDCNGVPAECMDAAPAYSPDGKRIAFLRATETSSVLAIRDLASGDVTILDSTRSSSSDVWLDEPSWSPDGQQIVYYKVVHDPVQDKVTDSSIFIVNADGSGLHELALPSETPWGDPDWSPDGTRIVFGSYPIRAGFAGGNAEVYSVRPDGTDLQQLTTLGVGSGAPSWTSDGAHIFFWGFQTFYLMDPDGGNAKAINRPALAFDNDGYGFYGALQPTP
jgi:dipeptidyl aminopeptidase/acylaminoacyl peptidase